MTVTIRDDRDWHLLQHLPFRDDSKFHNHNLRVILTIGVASYSILFDEEYVEGSCVNMIVLQAEQSDWLEDTDEEIDEQELEAHYSFMAKIQEVLTAESGYDVEPLEKVDSNVIPDSLDMCDKDNQTDQNAEECDDERVVLANLIANLKLDNDEKKDSKAIQGSKHITLS
ncbi:hypothetical protein Tco_1152705 [Tanacetum coccineum]